MTRLLLLLLSMHVLSACHTAPARSSPQGPSLARWWGGASSEQAQCVGKLIEVQGMVSHHDEDGSLVLVRLSEVFERATTASPVPATLYVVPAPSSLEALRYSALDEITVRCVCDGVQSPSKLVVLNGCHVVGS